jgi:hypothetical protein
MSVSSAPAAHCLPWLISSSMQVALNWSAVAVTTLALFVLARAVRIPPLACALELAFLFAFQVRATHSSIHTRHGTL